MTLTFRQWEVWSGIARGMTRKEIAQSLGLTVKSVDYHRTGLVKALGMAGCNDVELCRRAARCGLITLKR